MSDRTHYAVQKARVFIFLVHSPVISLFFGVLVAIALFFRCRECY